MTAIEIAGPEARKCSGRSRPVPHPGRGGADRGRGRRGQSSDVMQRLGSIRLHAARQTSPASKLPAGLRRWGPTRARRWRVGDEVCALVPAAVTPNTALRRRRSACPCPTESITWPPRRFPRRPSPSGRTSSTAGGCNAANGSVHGGTSGIGTTAIQLAHASGATVFAPRGSRARSVPPVPARCGRGDQLPTEDFVEVVRERQRCGVHAILDIVGGDYVAAESAVSRDGRPAAVQIGLIGGAR